MIVRRNVKKEILDNGIVKRTFDLYNDGGCQCWNDCDCYLDRGMVKVGVVTYNNRPTIEEALIDLKNKANSQQKQQEMISAAQEWKNSTSNKEINYWINKFKKTNPSLKRFNHQEIKDDPLKIMMIYCFKNKTTADILLLK